MSLPVKTGTDDVSTMVSYLRTKATGATISEAKAAVDSRLLDGRKLTAYEAWGFVTKDGDKLRLSPTGRELSRASDQQKMCLFSDVVRKVRPYKMATEWAFYQDFDQVEA